MLTEPLIQQLHSLRLKGMASCLEHQLASPDQRDRSFEDRLGLMIQHEMQERSGYRLAQRLRWAKLPMSACLEDLDTRSPRGMDTAQLAQVTTDEARERARAFYARLGYRTAHVGLKRRI